MSRRPSSIAARAGAARPGRHPGVFAGVVASGHKYAMGEQRPAVISGDLALTSTRVADGTVTAEVARRQADGTWLWVLDKFVNA